MREWSRSVVRRVVPTDRRADRSALGRWRCAVATLLASAVALVARLHTSPGPKRVHLFEDESGDRAAPFGGVSEGVDGDFAPACRACGVPLGTASYRYCPSCLRRRDGD